MRLSNLLSALVVPAVFAVAACSSGGSESTGGSGGQGGTGGVAPVETCRASFHWLQKDAYKETAGRTSDLWPPHTTTLLDVYCQLDDGDEELVTTTFQANHGTEPGAVDANGDVILVEVRADDIGGTRAQLLELVEAYKTCSCEGATKFLTLESLEDEAVQALVLNVISYLQAHLTCAVPGGTDAVTTALQNGDIAQVLADLPSCTWSTGSDLASGLDEAFDAFLATSQEALAGYHVCNNDAELQAALFASFITDKKVTPCNADVDTCKGPKWLYEP